MENDIKGKTIKYSDHIKSKLQEIETDLQLLFESIDAKNNKEWRHVLAIEQKVSDLRHDIGGKC